jgi:hypothetical protein
MGRQGAGLADSERLVDEEIVLAQEQGTIRGMADQARHARAAIDLIRETGQGSY